MKDWMEHLDPKIKDKPLIYLAIPGSHNCMTYTISAAQQIAPDNHSIVKFLVKLFRNIGRKTMYRWCVTQDDNVWEQLNIGIRYLDFRVATKSDSKIYFCHGLYGSEISTFLWVINNFLEESKGEVIIMDFQHFYDFTPENHEFLINKHIKGTFGDKLCPFHVPKTEVTINWMLKNGYRAIVIYRDHNIENKFIKGLWPGQAWPTRWPDTASLDTLQEVVQESVTNRDPYEGLITQCILTPDTVMVAFNPYSNLKKKCAKPVINKLRPWLKKQHPGPDGVNVVIADFVSTGAFHDLIIGLNDYYLDY